MHREPDNDEWLIRDQGAMCGRMGLGILRGSRRDQILREGGTEACVKPLEHPRLTAGAIKGAQMTTEWGQRYATF